jgi:hypothetical protein
MLRPTATGPVPGSRNLPPSRHLAYKRWENANWRNRDAAADFYNQIG